MIKKSYPFNNFYMKQDTNEIQTNTHLFAKLTVEESLAKLDSSWSGLSQVEAEKREKKFGLNILPRKQRFKWTSILLRQFSDPIVWILLVAGLLALSFGEFRDAIIILIIILVNAIIGFTQEYKAERILDSLQKFATDSAIITRDGEKIEIDSRNLVPGDIIFLDAGSSIPADARIIESFSLKVNSFIFSGESRPQKRDTLPMQQESPSPADATNLVFLGESVASGEARAVVIGTNGMTELGTLAKITEEIPDEFTPLQKKMRSLSKNITIISVIIGILVITIGQSYELTWYNSFLLALALAVSVVPEGLPAAISIAFTLGMKRLLRVNILAKKLNAVETLGSVTTICTDKTGTLTKGELTVTKIIVDEKIFDVSGEGYDTKGEFLYDGKIVSPGSLPNAEMLFKIGALCNDSSIVSHNNGIHSIIGDGTEGAILVATRKYNPNPDYFRLGETKLSENPFSSERMRMSVLFKNDDTLSLVKGSPDVLLSLCTEKLTHGKETPFTKEEKDRVQSLFNDLSKKSLRLLAFAYRAINDPVEKISIKEMEQNLVWVGMMAMTDPPRPGTRDALDECRALGLHAIMITGDYEITAQSIAEDIGLISKDRPYEIISGYQLEALNDEELFHRIKEKDIVFARIAPKEKLRIANILKSHGEVIAMTGDGVNDAPALKRADIGVAMGIIGTDVSKEASDMILLDDNFASIVKGVREGRTIFLNLKKFTHYVFTSNISELLTVTMGFIFGIPSPITAVQILAIDLGTDVLPSLALGMEPEEPNRGKEKNTASIIDREGIQRMASIGFIMAVGAVTAFLLSLLRSGWEWGSSIGAETFAYQKATAAAYTTLALTQMANLLQSRSATVSFFRLRFWGNPWVWGALFASIGMLWAVTSFPPSQGVLEMQTPDVLDWSVAGLFTLLVFFFEESRKRGLLIKSQIQNTNTE